MKLLKSHRNDFPQYYAEYSLNDLGNTTGDPLRFECETRAFRLESLDIDIRANGLTHPIIIWAFNVQIGHQRVWIAKRLGYTHISAYHVTDQEGYDKVQLVTMSEEYWQKYSPDHEKYLPNNDVMDDITTRII